MNLAKYQQSHPISKDNTGRTMIEVLVAMAIIAIGLVVVGSMVLSTTRNNKAGNMLTIATLLAREKIEYMKTLPIDHMEAQCYGDLDIEYLRGRVFQRVCQVSSSFSETAKIIEVTVSWNRQGHHREVVLKTISRGNGV